MLCTTYSGTLVVAPICLHAKNTHHPDRNTVIVVAVASHERSSTPFIEPMKMGSR